MPKYFLISFIFCLKINAQDNLNKFVFITTWVQTALEFVGVAQISCDYICGYIFYKKGKSDKVKDLIEKNNHIENEILKTKKQIILNLIDISIKKIKEE